MKNLFLLLSFYFLTSAVQAQAPWATAALDKSAEKYKKLLTLSEEKGRLPRSAEADNSIRWTRENHIDWTEGFFPGTLWLLYEMTGDETFKTGAENMQALYKSHKDNTTTHDVGFIFDSSYGRGFEITENPEYQKVVMDASKALASRFDPKVGAIRSWSWGGWKFPVIIDNMLNLELLMRATQISGDSSYWNMAITHANTTMKNHFRKDFSCYHVVDYFPEDGSIRIKKTHQGYANESAWSRGQSWALYGYTMMYRYTKDKRYLDFAENLAKYNFKKWPKDLVPVWDYDSPKSLVHIKDASAAAVFCSGLFDLYQQTGKSKYLKKAVAQLKSLSSEEYFVEEGTYGNFLIHQCAGNIPKEDEVEVGLNYGDYYYAEALKRYLTINQNP
ncbi:glycoside hydrolase family 88 protein [Persicobacter diffluens]|uniref:Glucuronyl hydrolase n=1 Tax=Persicobacter diffluens TaxID=981 RepID=A0AAN5ALN2_9BACT|nr:glucuronyl hydrolase [Persicobacter diffluens]